MAKSKSTSSKTRRRDDGATPNLSAASREFEAIADRLCRNDGVERVMLFGFDCLRASGKVFAKRHKGALVVKLPAGRITALMAAGILAPYERGRGGMKEWAVAQPADKKRLTALLRESLAFVRG